MLYLNIDALELSRPKDNCPGDGMTNLGRYVYNDNFTGKGTFFILV
jgi:hypothetical protein